MKHLLTFSLFIFCNVAGMETVHIIRQYFEDRHTCKNIPNERAKWYKQCGAFAMGKPFYPFQQCMDWDIRLAKQADQCEKRGWKVSNE